MSLNDGINGYENNMTSVHNASVVTSSSQSGMFVHPHWLQYEALSTGVYLAFGIVSTLAGIVAVVGNITVISLFFRHRSLRVSSNLLVLNLSVADLLMAAGNLPVFAISSFNGHWLFGQIGCQLYGFCGSLASLVSMNTLTVIALERSFVIANRSNFLNRTSLKTVKSAILFTWLFSFSWAISPVLGWGRYILEGSKNSCTFDFISRELKYRSFVIALLVCCFYIQLTIIIVSYSSIYIKVASHGREIDKLATQLQQKAFSSKFSNRRQLKREFNTAKIALGIIFFFCLSWMPYAVVAMVACFGSPSYISPLVASIPGLCAKSSTAINPILYALWHPKYRNKILKDSTFTTRAKFSKSPPYMYRSMIGKKGTLNLMATNKDRGEVSTEPKSRGTNYRLSSQSSSSVITQSCL